jgi:hypothetical protein
MDPASKGRQPVLSAGRHGRVDGALDEPVALQATKHPNEHFLEMPGMRACSSLKQRARAEGQ